MWWLMAREVLRLRGVLARDQRWDVVVDLFFYRDPEESEKEEQQAKEQVGEHLLFVVSFGSSPWIPSVLDLLLNNCNDW